MEALNTLVAAITGGVIVPIAQWIKKKLPADIGVAMPAVIALANVGVVYLLARFLAPEMTFQDVVNFSFGSNVVSGLVYAAYKKNTSGDEPPKPKEEIKSIEEKRAAAQGGVN